MPVQVGQAEAEGGVPTAAPVPTGVADDACILGTNCKDDIIILFALSISAFALLLAVAVVLAYRTFWSGRTKTDELALVPMRGGSGPVVSLAVQGEMELGGSSGSGSGVGMAFSPRRIAAL